MIVHSKDTDPEMRSIDIAQRIIEFISSIIDRPVTTIEYPVRCGICKAKTKGNIIIGYRMGCKEKH